MFTFLLVLFTLVSQGQVNIVPNPSFEEYIVCPDSNHRGDSQINKCKYWTGSTNGGSTDFYTSCSGYIPNVSAGYCTPRSGANFTGILPYILPQGTNGYREYLQTTLRDSLLSNHRYCISYYVTLSRTTAAWFEVRNLGAYVADTIPTPINLYAPLSVTPTIVNQPNNPLNGIANSMGVEWKEVRDTFIAIGGEKYMVIGNLYNDANTILFPVPGGSNDSGAYYFVDDVSLYCIDCPLRASFDNVVPSTCANDSVYLYDLSTGNPISWEWQLLGASPATSTLQNPVVTYAAIGAHSVQLIVTDINGNKDTIVKTIYTKALDAEIITPTNSCAPSVLTINEATNSNIISTWYWDLAGANIPTSTQQSPTTTYLNAGTYTASVIIKRTNGKMCYDTTTFVVVNPPTVTTTSTYTTVCAGWHTSIQTSGADTYLWLHNNATNANQTVSPTATTTYSVVGTKGLTGCIDTSTILITVKQGPTFSISSLLDTVCTTRANINLSAQPSGGTYGGTGIVGSQFSPQSVAPNTYQLIYTYTNASLPNCIGSDTATITVIDCNIGIKDIINKSAIKIYPNPASNILNVDIANYTNQQSLQLSFSNILGQNIAMFDIDEEHTELNVSGIQNGVYYVSLLQNGEQQFIQKLVLIK